MAGDDVFDFRPRPGRIRDSARSAGSRSFVTQVLAAAAKANGRPLTTSQVRRARTRRTGKRTRPKKGRCSRIGRGQAVADQLKRGAAERRPGERMRRVVVKARIVRLKAGSRAADAHIRYLQRDGTTRDGDRGQLYSAETDEANGKVFTEHGRKDRHQFRFIVAPEDGEKLSDMRAFTRDVMRQMEEDLGTRLDWIAVDHFNTGHPHSHVILRGREDSGKDLIIAQDYITDGLRLRAQERATLELGPETNRELRTKLQAEVSAERFTRIDRAMIAEANEHVLDLRPHPGEVRADFDRTLRVGRLRTLERYGLAKEAEPGMWVLSERLEPTLRELGERSDIIKTMHRAITERGLARSAEFFVVRGGAAGSETTIGRVIAKGLAGDELTNQQHLVIDGLDGRVHHLEVTESDAEAIGIGNIVAVGSADAAPRRADRTIAELARQNGGIYQPSEHLAVSRATARGPHHNHEGHVEAHVRRLEALRQAGIVERFDGDHWHIPEDFVDRTSAYDKQVSRQPAVRVLSLLDLDAQVTANAATWLDRELIRDTPSPRVEFGFGQDVGNAIAARRQWLLDEGLMRTHAGQTTYRRDMLAVLARRERDEVGRKLAAERGTSFRTMGDGERVSGTYKESVQLVSGKYALVENAREFTLVPWRPVIDKDLGRAVTGVVRGDDISWQFGRAKGLGLGM
jgi:type IV secretory pathway VirD2 relaxase